MRDAYKVLVGKSEGKRPLGRPRCGWEDSIRTHLREVARKAVDCAYLAQDRDQCGSCGHGNEPLRSVKRREIS
jgi:hypothetical protein